MDELWSALALPRLAKEFNRLWLGLSISFLETRRNAELRFFHFC